MYRIYTPNIFIYLCNLTAIKNETSIDVSPVDLPIFLMTKFFYQTKSMWPLESNVLKRILRTS